MTERERSRRLERGSDDWSLMVGDAVRDPRGGTASPPSGCPGWWRWPPPLLGLGFYQFDNGVKDSAAEGSTLKRMLNDVELVVLGPGMGVLGYLVTQNLRLRDEAHLRRLSEEKRQQLPPARTRHRQHGP